MPLSEDEQRILHEIEQQFYESDPAFADEVGKTTLYRHAGRNLKWAALGFVAGLRAARRLVRLVACGLGLRRLPRHAGLGFVFERNLRKMGRAGWQQVTDGMRAGNLRDYLGDAGKRFRGRFKKDE